VFNEAGEVVGIAFQSYAGSDAENIGYVIPTPVINHFINDYQRNGTFTGFPALGVQWQRMESAALRCAGPALTVVGCCASLASSLCHTPVSHSERALPAVHVLPAALSFLVCFPASRQPEVHRHACTSSTLLPGRCNRWPHPACLPRLALLLHRKHFKMSDEQKGVLVRSVQPISFAHGQLFPNDVLLAFEGVDIASGGSLPCVCVTACV
jgi:hypothetical protein